MKFMNLKLRRLIAMYIDFHIAFLIGCIFTVIPEKLFFESILVDSILGLIFILIFIILILRKDMVLGYESIGKKIMRLKIYDENGMRIKNKKKLIDRVYYSLFTFECPFYPYIILINNRSRGDRIEKTVVK